MAQYVDIPLDKSRRLRYTINAIRELERHFGKTFGQIFDANNLGYEEIIMLLTIGLKYGESEKRPLNDTRVGELVQKKWLDNGKDLGELTDYVIEAMQAAGIIAKKPDKEEEPDDDRDDTPSGEVKSLGGRKDLPNV